MGKDFTIIALLVSFFIWCTLKHWDNIILWLGV